MSEEHGDIRESKLTAISDFQITWAAADDLSKLERFACWVNGRLPWPWRLGRLNGRWRLFRV